MDVRGVIQVCSGTLFIVDKKVRYFLYSLRGIMSEMLNNQNTHGVIEISVGETADLWKRKIIKLLDVRAEDERALAKIDGVPTVDQELAQEIINKWQKDTPIVLHCHHGIRSLDAASYFIGHGFTNVKSMKGGIAAWSQEIDSSVPQY